MLAIVLVTIAGALGASWAAAAPAPDVSGRAARGGAELDADGSAGGGPPPGPTGQGAPGVRAGTGGGPSGAGSGGGGDGGGAAGGDGAAPTTEYARVPDCGANAPGGVLPETLCNNATLTCPEPGAIRYRLYARSTEVPDGEPPPLWVPQGLQCLTAAELAAAGAAGPAAAAPVVVTLADFQKVPFAPGTSLLAPPGGQALVNLAVHVHADAQVQVLPTVVQGAAVQVRATPVAYAWDFGDGASTGPSPDPGAAWPEAGHEHAYAVPGPRAVAMSTTYAGEFSVAGGPWQPIDGQVTIVSPAQPVLVRTARASLVGDLLG